MIGLDLPDEDLAFFEREVASSAGWVAVAEDVVRGFALTRDGWLNHLFVDVGWQGRGIGTALLGEAVARVGEQPVLLGLRDGARPPGAAACGEVEAAELAVRRLVTGLKLDPTRIPDQSFVSHVNFANNVLLQKLRDEWREAHPVAAPVIKESTRTGLEDVQEINNLPCNPVLPVT